jgi:predicted ATPase/class 3 adenylate cyclase
VHVKVTTWRRPFLSEKVAPGSRLPSGQRAHPRTTRSTGLRLRAITSAKLPTGTVTFLFTDIEGSTRLLHELGRGPYAAVLEEHHRLLREVIVAHDGREVDTEGDAFFVAFARPTDALAAAADSQRRISDTEWPQGGEIRVRMGLHAGEALVSGGKYVGVAVHRAARIAAAAHGGQVLVSEAVYQLVVDEDLDGASFRDLGDHRLKDLSEPQRLHQLLVEGVRSDFPPPRTLENRPTNLPVQPTVLIGRDREVKDTLQLLDRADVRLLTLTGPGGTGKTRLALQLAAEVVDDFPDGVFFVTLAPLTDPELVVPTIAQTLAVHEQPGRTVPETLGDFLGEKKLLLVLDNFEQVIEAAAEVAAVMACAPRVKAVVTSRAPIHVAAEHEYAVPPLALPDPGHLPQLQVLTQYEAVALFIERARAVKPDFEVASGNAAAVAEICVRLDGLPLAIELAAARVRMLPPQAILQRLDQRLKLLVGGARDAPARQQTLHGAIDWSYRLLPEPEQRLFADLSVFVGGCTLEAAEKVCERDGVDVFEGLSSLIEKSLLRQAEGEDGESRFLMLETIREYASQRLEERDEADELRRRHAEYVLTLVQSEADLMGERGPRLLRQMDAERDNLRAALEYLLASGVTEETLELVEVVWPFWLFRGYLEEGRRWAEKAVKQSSGTPSKLRTWVVSTLGEFLRFQGKFEEAIEAKNETLAVARELGEVRMVAATLHDLGEIYMQMGDREQARRLHEEALVLRRQDGRRVGIAHALVGLGDLALVEGDFERARSIYEEILETGRESGESDFEANGLLSLAEVARRENEHVRANELLREGLAVAVELGSVLRIVQALETLAALACAEGPPERAARLIGGCEQLRRESGFAVFDDAVTYARTVEAARTQLGSEAFDRERSAGAMLSREDVIAFAVEGLSAQGAEG